MKKVLFIALSIALIGKWGSVSAQSENVIPENGKVGLGTLNPSAKLDVNGNVHIDSMLMVKDSILIQKNARIKQNLKVEGQFSLPNLSQSDSVSTLENLLLYDKQNEVVKTLKFSDLNEYLYNQKCEQKTDEFGNVLLPTWLSQTNKLFIDCPQVFVGIANNTPRVNLDVWGTTYSQKLALGIANPLNMKTLFHAKANLDEEEDSTLFVIENNQRKIFQINNNGLVLAREIKVNLDSWPDYVFEKNYRLKPLSEVEMFILKNKHLPDVPDAKTVEEDGINLGEMNKILMQKVEELTLYLIEQQKNITNLNLSLEEQIKKSKEIELKLEELMKQ